jgi:hypothetical protein
MLRDRSPLRPIQLGWRAQIEDFLEAMSSGTGRFRWRRSRASRFMRVNESFRLTAFLTCATRPPARAPAH